MAENGAPAATATAVDAAYVLPEKWTEDTVDEKGEKMSKTCVRVGFFRLELQPSASASASERKKTLEAAFVLPLSIRALLLRA